LSHGQVIGPWQGIGVTTICDQVKAPLRTAPAVLRGQGDGRGARRLAKATTTVCGTIEKRRRLKAVETFWRK
jgi:hypothetical protein